MNTESPSGEYSKDFELLSPPEDSISALSWSPAANFLAASSCDTLVHIYDVTKSTTGMLETAFGLDGTVLSCDWSQVMLALTESPFRHMLRTEYPQDGRVVAVAGADPKVKLFDLHAEEVAAENYRQPSTHPISTILQRHRSNSYACHRLRDKTVKFWDLGSRKCAGSLPCHDKVYSIDLKNKLLVIATAEKRVYTVDLNRFTQFFTTTNGPLKAQTRVVSCFPDASGYGIGSIEGKYAFSYVDPYRRSQTSIFKCHRSPAVNNTVEVYSVNAISFHPVHSSCSTAGSDGTFNFWDPQNDTRPRPLPSAGAPISATDFNRDGTIFAYAVSY